MLANNFNTNIDISYKRFNINKLGFVINEDSKISNPNKINNIIKMPKIIPKEFRFSIVNISKYTLIFLIDNEAAFFSINVYMDLLINSNIKLIISSNEKFKDFTSKFYSNIYDSNEKYDNIMFTNKFYKKIPLNAVDINKCYIFNNDYNIKNKYNCFYFNNRTDYVNVETEEYDYQKFSSNSINWFISKIFNNKLHLYNPSNVIICTDNLDELQGVQYIFIDCKTLNYFDIYFNWFNFTYSSFNLQLSEFILLIIGYYFSKLTIHSNIFINSFINNNTEQTIGLKKNGILYGIQSRDKNIGDFFDYIKLVTNKFGDVKLNIDRTSSIKHIILIKNYNNELALKNIYVKPLNYSVDDIDLIKMSCSNQNIWLFDSLEDFNSVKNDLEKFPNENLKIKHNKLIFHKIYNSPNEIKYKNVQYNEYVIDFTKLRKLEISRVLQDIQLYTNKIILTILIDTTNHYNYFKYYYNNKGYKILFINLFNLPIEDNNNDNNNLIVNYSDSIIDNTKLVFVKPNYYIDHLNEITGNNKIYLCRYFKDVDKSLKYRGIFSVSNRDEQYNKIYVVNIDINIIQRIKLNKFYNSILKNNYVGLFYD